MKDPQQQRVYAWETDFADWNRETLTLQECRAVVAWACSKYGVKTPTVGQHTGKNWSYAIERGGRVYVSFMHEQKNPAVALHEAAHVIADAIFGTTAQAHGPEWLGIYLWLLEGYRLVPRSALWASARAKRLRWTATWTMSPKRLRRRN